MARKASPAANEPESTPDSSKINDATSYAIPVWVKNQAVLALILFVQSAIGAKLFLGPAEREEQKPSKEIVELLQIFKKKEAQEAKEREKLVNQKELKDVVAAALVNQLAMDDEKKKRHDRESDLKKCVCLGKIVGRLSDFNERLTTVENNQGLSDAIEFLKSPIDLSEFGLGKCTVIDGLEDCKKNFCNSNYQSQCSVVLNQVHHSITKSQLAINKVNGGGIVLAGGLGGMIPVGLRKDLELKLAPINEIMKNVMGEKLTER